MYIVWTMLKAKGGVCSDTVSSFLKTAIAKFCHIILDIMGLLFGNKNLQVKRIQLSICVSFVQAYKMIHHNTDSLIKVMISIPLSPVSHINTHCSV